VSLLSDGLHRIRDVANPSDAPSASLPAARCNSDLAQYSITPSLRAAGSEDEDDDEDENEAPCELESITSKI
jgi:hypothetical protein